jgi:branched-chain amino acid transport system permease protein
MSPTGNPKVVDRSTHNTVWFGGNRWTGVAILAGLCLYPVFVRDAYFLHIAVTVFIYIIYTSTYRFVLRLGQLHFGAHAFIAAGAYASAILAKNLGLPVWLSMPLAAVISAFVAALVGYPALRVKGVYFAIITWGFAEGLRFLFIRVKNPFGGNGGISAIPRPESIPIPFVGDIVFYEKTPYYFFGLALMLFTLWVLYRLEKSKFGLVFASIREGDHLAQSIGVNIMNYKVLAFAVCSGLAGLAGAFYAHYTVFIGPKDFTVILTITLALYVCVGGLDRFSGPIVGTTVLLIVGEFFTGFGMYRVFLFTGLTIIVLLFMPTGLVSLPQKILSKSRQWEVKKTHGPA